jgi:hypothetical protein
MSKRIGPSMSTEPGWMAVALAEIPSTWELGGRWPQNDPSMLLSFERPAPPAPGAVATYRSRPHMPDTGRVHASPRSLKTAQKPHQPPSISGG